MNSSVSISALYRETWRDCLRLCVVASLVLSVAGLVLLPLRDEVLYELLGVFLPADWIASMQLANEALFHQIGGALLFQTVAIVCFSAVSVLFFPFRDRISLRAEACLTGKRERGPGLHRELWYEAGLVLIAFNMYSCVYLLAYAVGEPLFAYIDLLAFTLLAAFFVLDLLSPPHFRRGLNCLQVIRAWPRLPLQLLLFGVLFCSPVFALELFLGDLVLKQEDDRVLGLALVAIIVVNCVICTFALPLGTLLALRSIDQDEARDAGKTQALFGWSFFATQFAVAALLVFFYASLVGVVLSKVPLKTADYDIHWLSFRYTSSTEVSPPRLGFDIEIHNRHESLGLQVNDADLLLNLEGRYLGEAGLDIPYVAPQSSAIVPVELELRVDLSEFAGIAWQEVVGYFGGEPPPWRENIQARLDVQLPLGLELPIYITQGYRHEFAESDTTDEP